MFKRILFILFILFILSGITHAQPEVDWDHLYGQSNEYGQIRNYCYAMTPTAEGGYAMAGRYADYQGGNPDSRHDAFLIVTDSTGEALWSRRYADSTSQTATAIVQTEDGGFLLAGYWTPYGFAVKTDDEGEEQWRVIFEDEGNGVLYGIAAAGDGTYVLSGYKFVNGEDCWLMKIDEDGGIIWSETYGSNRREWGGEVIKTRDGGFALGGFTSFDDDRNVEGLLLKVNENGEEEWLSTFGTEYNEQTLYIVQTHDGGYAAAGEIATVEMSSTSDMFLARLDSEGDVIWMESYGGNLETGGETIYAIQQSKLDHGFILAGIVPPGNPALRIVRTDQHGEEMWTMDMQGASSNGLTGLVELPDHSYVVSGSANRYWIEGEPDLDSFFLGKTTPDPLVDEAVELAVTDRSLDFGEVWTDSTSTLNIEVYNEGLRYGDIDSIVVIEGFDVFSCPLDSALRLFPEDTTFLPVTFQPIDDTLYTGTILLWFGDRQNIGITLSGRGAINSAPEEPHVLREFALYEAYPNPFNSTTSICYQLSEDVEVTLKIFDISGREVVTLVNGKLNAGYHTVAWEANVPSGLYVCRMEAGSYTRSIKLVLNR
jgi:hypothetical protein